MTDTAHYIIKKQILDIRHGRHENAFARQTEINMRYKNEVLPLLEKICLELCPGDRLIKIDTLIVELPPMTERNYKANWVEETEKAFRKSLSEAITKAGEAQYTNATVLSRDNADLKLLASFLYTGNLPWSYKEEQHRSPEVLFRGLINKNASVLRRLLREGLKQETFTKRLCYQFSVSLLTRLFSLLQPIHAAAIEDCYRFLHYGLEKTGHIKNHPDAIFLLHYHSLQQLAKQLYKDDKQFMTQVLRQIAYEKNIRYGALLNDLLSAVKPVKQETTSSCPASFKALCEKLQAISKEGTPEKKKITADAFLPNELQQIIRKAEYIIHILDEGKEAASYESLRKKIKQLLIKIDPDKKAPGSQSAPDPSKEEKDGIAELQQLLREAESLTNTIREETAGYNQLKERLLNYLQLMERNPSKEAVSSYENLRKKIRQFLIKTDSANQPVPDPSKEEKDRIAELQQLLREAEHILQETPEEKESMKAQDYPKQEPDELYLQNAGMVIVWPFFKRLFEALKLTENHQFTSEEKQHKAMYLLHYLATKEEECSEHRLALNKLLCGLELSEPIPQEIKLLWEEKESIEDLIQSAIGHWAAMKNTSVEGFREAFLSRSGKLSRNSNGRLLQIEQKSYDVIMNSLPWAISLVKLPWMPDPLFVEW